MLTLIRFNRGGVDHTEGIAEIARGVGEIRNTVTSTLIKSTLRHRFGALIQVALRSSEPMALNTAMRVSAGPETV